MSMAPSESKELRAPSSSRDGVTLVEVMVATAILILALAGAYNLVSLSTRLARVARNQYLATTIARSRVERAQTFDYVDLHLLAEDGLLVNEYGAPDQYGEFRRTTLVNTNYDALVTSFEVTVEIKTVATGHFEGLEEAVDTLFTEELGP